MAPYKKPRKRRTIKNSIVNIDDVFVERGLGNKNWLSIAKKKLTDRELKLLHKRLQIVDRIIIASIQQFVHRSQNTFNFNLCIDIYEKEIRYKLVHSQSLIMSLYARSIANMLQKWNGCKTHKEFHSFRHYFQNCRRGFDNKKIRMMTIHCWIPFMQLIHEFALKAASRLFGNRRFERELETLFCDYLNVLVLKPVFEGTMKPANTRSMWVIPAMSYQAFLKRYNHYLRIVPETHPNKNKAIRTEYLRCINMKHDHLKEVFDGRLNAYLPQHLPSVPIRNGNVFSQVQCQNDNVNNSAVWSTADTFKTAFANQLSFHNTNPMSDIQRTLPSISYPAIPVNENKEYFTTEPLRVDGSNSTIKRSQMQQSNVDSSNVSTIRSTPQAYYAENTFKTGFENAFSFGTHNTNRMSRNQTALSSYSVNGNHGDDVSIPFAMGSTHQAYASNVPFQQSPVDAPNPSVPNRQPCHCCCCCGCCNYNPLYN